MSDAEAEVFKALREGQNRYTYFLLAAVGGTIALVVNQTSGRALSFSQIPLALAVGCWGLSFVFGCRYLAYVNSSLYANMELFRIQRGEHPVVGSHPEMIEAGCEGITAAVEHNSERANRLAKWQFRMFVIGALFYLAWHVAEMYLRTN